MQAALQVLTSDPMILKIAIILALWVLLALLVRALLRNPWGTVPHGIFWLLGGPYRRFVHHLRVIGRADLLHHPPPGPLIIMANHTAGVDPILIQSVCTRPIRWIMAEDMREPALAWIWDLFGVIFVDRRTRRAQGLREAIRHLRSGGVVGIFPEGGLERPPRRLRPFEPGVGVLVQRTGAPVLPVVIRGTPHVSPAWASLWRPSRSVLEVGDLIEIPPDKAGDAREVTRLLESRFRSLTGWDEDTSREAAIDPARAASAA